MEETKKLIDLKVAEFADIMASDAPAPGGGSASALASALGGALLAMVCELTEGREKYKEFEPKAQAVKKEAQALKDSFLDAVDKDTQAFDEVSTAFGLPKGTDEEKAARSAAIQKGLVACIESPLAMMRLGRKLLHLMDDLFGGFNPSCASDLGVGVLMVRTGMEGAWLNVKINLGSLKDKEQAAAFEAEAREILADAIPRAEALYGKIEQML